MPLEATDADGDSLSYSASSLPAGLSLDSSTGVIGGTVDAAASASSPFAVTVTASDGVDPASSSFTCTVQHFTLENPGDQTNGEGDAISLQLIADANTSPTLTY